MAAYPIKLSGRGAEDGWRRQEMLEWFLAAGPLTMESMVNKLDREDLRWLWRAGLLEVIRGRTPMTYGITLMGKGAIERLPQELERIRKAQEKKQREEALAS